ncbi:MAG: glycosyltransferase [Prevotella sp.]|nr:glycosyltransferase [Prevotella sp.]
MLNSNEHPTPLVSFIITYYDLPATMLHECIDSIKALSLRHAEREIIVVDDGSSMSPLGILSDCLDDIIYIRQKNGGLSAARNMGIRAAAGRYLQFVDADDLLVTAPYEHCMDIVRYQAPDMVVFDLTDKELPVTAIYDDSPVIAGCEYLRLHNIKGSACSYIFKRTALSELRFTPGIYHEDEEFTPLLMLRADTLVNTNAKAYLYRRRNESITTKQHVRHRLKRLNDAQQILFRLLKAADTMPTENRMALKRRVHQLTMDYIYNVILLTKSRHYLNRKLEELRRKGIYPLPDREYTKKYTWFRRMANSNIGLSVLMRMIPLMKKEK